ncbi:MAG: hypothetical protein KIT29_02305 [Anaerolineales bacterium]|nr:hypothetical protein [Anaerolineales bacterium]
MKTPRWGWVLLLLAAGLLSACGGLSTEAAIATGIAQTLQISGLETAAAANGVQATAVQAAQDTPAAGAADAATATALPELGTALVSVTQDTNCRSGPSVQYRLITTIAAGQQVQVLKTFQGSEYVVVQVPGGAGDCWLWLRYATSSDFSAYNLPAATQPPTPTATLTPTATATPLPSFGGAWTSKTASGASNYTGAITFTLSGNTVTGSTQFSTYSYSFTGTLSGDGQQVSGTWTSSVPSNGNWTARLLNNNQFSGNIGNGWSFCGWRNGASEPGSCQWP